MKIKVKKPKMRLHLPPPPAVHKDKRTKKRDDWKKDLQKSDDWGPIHKMFST